jgi:hypothetical protein
VADPSKIAVLLEAERRGILPPDKQMLLDEARRRGLVSNEGVPLEDLMSSNVKPQAPTAQDKGAVKAYNAGKLNVTPEEVDLNKAQTNVSPWEAKAKGLWQGVTFGQRANIEALGGGAGAAIAAPEGQKWDAFKQYFRQARNESFEDIEQTDKAHPGFYRGGVVIGSLPAGMGAAQMGTAGQLASGGLMGASFASGQNPSEDLNSIARSILGGGLFGVAATGAGIGINKALASNTPSGMAYNAIDQASPQGIDDLTAATARSGGSPAEQSPVLADTLRNFSEQAPKQAQQAIGPAQTRMAAVNQQAKGAVDTYLSPENARLLTDKISQLARVANKGNYEGAAYQNPAIVSLVKEISENPAVKDALPAVQKLAAVQGRPDPLAAGFSTADLDALQRALKTMSAKAFNSTPENTLMGGPYGQFADDVNSLAVKMTPALGKAQSEAAVAIQAKEAIELGGKALAPGREAAEVAQEFATLSTQAKEAYQAGLATKLRAMIDAKRTGADAGAIFDTPGLADKLIAAGFPQKVVEQIVKGGSAARNVLNALQGGSDTAQKLLAAEAGKSPLSQVTARDFILSALTNIPTMGTVKLANIVGQNVEKKAAEKVVEAISTQGPQGLIGLIKKAPQTYAPFLNLIFGTSGSVAAPTIFPPAGGR